MSEFVERNKAKNRTDSRPVTERTGGWILAATIGGSSMVFIDSTVVNIALPALQADLGADVFDIQWVVEIYMLFLAALILVGGALGDRLGRRRIYAVGVSLFSLASIGCGLAPNVPLLILGRAVQGIGGALLVPGSLAIINAGFEPERRGQAIGTWSGFSAITTALGPLLGGWLIDQGSWRWVFFINVPLALLVLIILYWRVPESRNTDAPAGLDWPGALLATLGLGGLTYGLIEAGNVGFSDLWVTGALVVGVVALGLFVLQEATSRWPMLPLKLFRSKTFSGANFLTFTLYAGLGGMFFFLPLNLIQVQQFSTTAAGAAMLPFVLALFVLSRWTGGLSDRFGAKRPLVGGTLIAAMGFALATIPGVGADYWTTFFPALLVLGLGMALSIPPLTASALGAVDTRYSGLASGVNNTVARVGGLLAVAVLGIVVVTIFNIRLNNTLSLESLPPQARHVLANQRARLAGADFSAVPNSAVRQTLSRATKRAYVAGFRVAMLLSTALALFSSGVALFTIAGAGPPPD